jgi:hypothetical protein
MSMMVNPYVLAPAGGGGGPDPNWANVVLLMGFEGADASTTFVDESSVGRTMTAIGNAQIDTAQFKFGAASGLFDGSGDVVTAADSADWDFGSGDFTIEMFVRHSVNASQGYVEQYTGGGNRSWSFIRESNQLRFFCWIRGGRLSTAPWSQRCLCRARSMAQRPAYQLAGASAVPIHWLDGWTNCASPKALLDAHQIRASQSRLPPTPVIDAHPLAQRSRTG